MAATYQIKITNHTNMSYKYIVKPPNIPSHIPLKTTMIFPNLYTCTLVPSATALFTTDIRSTSEQAHLFLVRASPISTEQHMLPLETDILIDFWKDEGGLKGDYCSVAMVRGTKEEEEGAEGKGAWRVGFSWRAWTLAPKIEVIGTGPGGAMRYEDK